MKKYIKLASIAVVVLLLVFSVVQCDRGNKNYEKYIKELQNVEAYRQSNDTLKNEAKVYQMSIEELQNSRDSLDIKLMKIMKDLDIAKSKVKNMQYQARTATRVDTVTLSDTIFIKDFSLDTTIGDRWYNVNLQLNYPSTIVTTPTFNSEQYIYVYNKKEYVGGKSKCFFINWFKKKYISTEVKIEEKNPYINTTQQKFINIE